MKQINRQTSTVHNPGEFSREDLTALAAIKQITDDGDNAEVKKKDGKLAVYKVKKQKAV